MFVFDHRVHPGKAVYEWDCGDYCADEVTVELHTDNYLSLAQVEVWSTGEKGCQIISGCSQIWWITARRTTPLWDPKYFCISFEPLSTHLQTVTVYFKIVITSILVSKRNPTGHQCGLKNA